MMHNERGSAGGQSPILNTQSPNGERVARAPEKGKEKSIVERMSATVLDIGLDILTANEMAKEKFGNSALMEAGKAATTLAIGIGLEEIFNKFIQNAIAEKKPVWFNKIPIPFTEASERLQALEKSNPRWHHFILQSTKDLFVGTTYNGLVFFSKLLEFAGSEQLVGSLAVNATEAMFTKGLDYELKLKGVQDARESVRHRDDIQIQSLREVAKSMKGLKPEDMRTHELKEKQSVAIKERLKLHSEKKKLIDPTNTPLEWQTFLRKFTAYSNPATLLGLDMLGSSMTTFTKNLKEVRKVREEKKIVGKSVDMPKKYEKKEWGNRDSGGRWQGNKDKVYYGKSTWKSADQKAQEEYELKAGS